MEKAREENGQRDGEKPDRVWQAAGGPHGRRSGEGLSIHGHTPTVRAGDMACAEFRDELGSKGQS